MAAGIELLRRYAVGRSEAAFAALVQQHLSLVYQAALRRTNGDTHLAEEVAQSVFASLAREADSLHKHAALTGWLYVATRHAAANAMRSEQRRKVREREAQTMNEQTNLSQSDANWEQLRPEIDSVMDELKETDRDAVLLRFFENRPYAEIGANFRISEDAARMRVERALEKLRSLLARRGITSTAAALGGLLTAQSAVAAPAGLSAAVTGAVLAGSGVATTASGSAAFIAFMTTNKMMMGIAGAAIMATSVAVYEYRDVKRVETELTELSSGMNALKGQLARKEAEVQAAEEKRATGGVSAAKTVTNTGGTVSQNSQGQSTSTTGGGSKPKSNSSSWMTGRMDILYASPEFVQLELQRTALDLGERYGGLYRRLGLTTDQVREFESLMLQQHQNMFDLFAAARAKGVSVNDPALRQLNDPAQQAIQMKMQALLGQQGFEAYKDYTGPGASIARSRVGDLAGKLYATDPLSAEQADRLIDLIVAKTPSPKQGAGFIMENGQTDWAAIYAQAKGILSPVQLATLQAANRSMEISLQQSQLSDRLLQEAAGDAAN